MSRNVNDWQVFNVDDLKGKVSGSEPRIYEFINQQSMSGIVYHLPAGSRDLQAPHAEDEIYVVLEGRARLKVAEEEHVIGPGSVLFVRATTSHSFFDIDEDLTVLAFFGAQGPR